MGTGVTELKKVEIDKLKRDVVKIDANFYLALSEAKLAWQVEAARPRGWQDDGGCPRRCSNIHFYDAAKTLGDLAVSLGKFDQAVKYYGALANASSTDLKIEAVYLTGVSKLRQNDAAGCSS